MESAERPIHSRILAAAGIVCVAAGFVLTYDDRVLDLLTLVLAAGAVVATVLSVRYSGPLHVSASFTCSIVAIAVAGPAAAFLVAVVGTVGDWAIFRFRYPAFKAAINLLATGVPNLVAGTLFAMLGPSPDQPGAFLLALAPTAILALMLSYTVVSVLMAPTLGEGLRKAMHPPSPFAPALLWAVPVAAVVAYVAAHAQTLGVLALVLTLLGLTYMLQLVQAQRVAAQERSLAGHDIIAGMLRALQQRDEESARHAAAVATYASDLAAAAGFDEEACRDAHAAGLMHDLGRLSISDVALHATGDLSEREWEAIQRHPHAGAEMLRHVGVDGDVAAAVAAHHERIDGRGYPLGLVGEAIPPLARIVAVAEVYDTLTAGTTYRPPMSSFQALTELRRVAGTQLDERFVEALAAVLAHRPLEGRHATAVDLDAELAFERRIAQAIP